MMYPRLDSSNDDLTSELQEGQTPKIIPLFKQPKEKKQEIGMKEYVDTRCNEVAAYVDIQDNKVVAFVINWIKTTFTKDLLEYLNVTKPL